MLNRGALRTEVSLFALDGVGHGVTSVAVVALGTVSGGQGEGGDITVLPGRAGQWVAGAFGAVGS